ncbi:MAG: tRNA 4-thiouridine(8) synthase ThiI [Candidatus Omnitrophica bacterium]|jgi:tRNA U34 2-thiouridine synthase MnmA/TrmU|nr:tRNA 4-thiouridine(8) synthase ThiI [Candidatus Omnitrophota bacterium]
MKRAIALISGGLDSILASCVVKEQGIDVFPVKFIIPFLSAKKSKDTFDKTALVVKQKLGRILEEIDIQEEFLEMMRYPQHGFGSNMNPCIDCKILMLKKAGQLLKAGQADFLVTGEVLSQRPMSQNKQAINFIPGKAGLERLILRPLCAKLLPVTLPEEKGWVMREKLFSINGRSRKAQMELAEYFKIKDYAQPAGGCLLTDPDFSRRLKDLIAHKQLKSKNVQLLKLGRHFRLNNHTKLVVGRNQQENLALEKMARPGDFLFYVDEDTAGPTAVGSGGMDDNLISLSCSVVARYSDIDKSKKTEIMFQKVANGKEEKALVYPIDQESLSRIKI